VKIETRAREEDGREQGSGSVYKRESKSESEWEIYIRNEESISEGDAK
jgi:hypothetical protein